LGRVGLVTDRATGPASLVQGDYRSDEDHGDFEALIPMAEGLWHRFRKGATGEWTRAARLTDVVGSVGCLTLSNYEADGGHRSLEALVFESRPSGAIGMVAHFFWKRAEARWERARVLTDAAVGPARLIQGDYVQGTDHHNLEALVPVGEGERRVLRHFFRRDDPGSLDWAAGPAVTDRVLGAASMIRGDFHAADDHGNVKAIFVEVGNDVWHAFRDQSALAWRSAGTVM
jgi:hypothetical protein